MSNKVTVAAIQMTYGLEEACEKVREAASQGAQIILLPELFENWYFCQEKSYENYHLATTLEENPAVREMQTIARDFKVVIPVSYYERVGAERPRSTRWLILDADGTILGISTVRPTSRMTITIRKSSISHREIPALRCGIRNTRELASGYAGTSGFRRLRGEWQYRGRSYYFIRQL